MVAARVDDWLQRHAARVRPQTVTRYRVALEQSLVRVYGGMLARDLGFAHIREVLHVLEREQRAPATMAVTRAALSLFLADLVADGVLAENPIKAWPTRRRRGRRMRLVYDERQLELFLETAAITEPVGAPVLTACGRAGLRIGESLALQAGDLDFPGRHVRVVRTLLRDRSIGPPKGGPRIVDMSAHLARVLEDVAQRHPTGWLFPRKHGPLGYSTVRDAMLRVAAAAGLPHGAHPHLLRHSYASILIARGVSIEYVRRQLGHSSIALTVDLYGSHLPFPRPHDLDEL